MSEYTCYVCKETYEDPNNYEWNKFKAAEEMLTLYPESKNAPTEILCDYCNKEFVKWFSTLSEEEKKQIRKDKN